MSFWSLTEDERADRNAYIESLINQHIDAQLREFIDAVRFLHPTAAEVRPFYFMSRFLGPIQHKLRFLTNNNVSASSGPMPPAYIITCADWSEQSVLHALRSMQGGTGTK